MSKNKKRNTLFNESLFDNNITYIDYFNNITELALSVFEWKNLPSSVDERFLELCLFNDGMCLFFYDDVLGYLTLQTMIGGKLNVYRIPTERKAYASNGYNRVLNENNSVIIFNNYLHTNCISNVQMYSKRLYNIDRAIDVNVNAQKTPILLQCDETQRLTMLNLYKEYEGNQPFIFGTKSLDVNGIKTINTGAPFVCDKLFELKTQIWNECMMYLGISNVSIVKKERMISDEVNRSMGGTYASRYTRLNARKKACKEINDMFGLNVDVVYRDEFIKKVEENNE